MAEGARGERQARTLALYRLALMITAATWLGAELGRSPVELHPSMLQWVALLAVVELVATEAWGGPGLSVGFGIQVAVAMLYDPVAAGLIAFAGAFDPREPRRQIRPLHDLSRRALALSVVATGSAVFHAMASSGIEAPLGRLAPVAAVTVALMFAASLGAELLDRVLDTGRSARELLRDMNRVSPYRFPVTFPGIGWLSLPVAVFSRTWGLWPAVVVFGLAAYARRVCIKARNLGVRLEERNAVLDFQARELAVLLSNERRVVAELEELTRLKGQLVATASHEVRTPLTSIIGYATALRRMPAEVDLDRRNEFLGIIDRQAKRLLNLVERLLTASRLESGKFVTTPDSIDAGDLCHEVVESLGVDSDRVAVELPADLPEIVTDRRYLSQILANLIDNALKYSPRDGLITIGARRESDRLAFWVQDHGIGIPDSERRRIFDRFYRVDGTETRKVGGVGLGLTLVGELVEALGATIAVDSEVGWGSRFTVTLPLRAPAAKLTREPTGSTTNGPRTNEPNSATRPTGHTPTSPIRRGPDNL